jgi:hypothetical protein
MSFFARLATSGEAAGLIKSGNWRTCSSSLELPVFVSVAFVAKRDEVGIIVVLSGFETGDDGLQVSHGSEV